LDYRLYRVVGQSGIGLPDSAVMGWQVTSADISNQEKRKATADAKSKAFHGAVRMLVCGFARV
jgi:hypothetical protein